MHKKKLNTKSSKAAMSSRRLSSKHMSSANISYNNPMANDDEDGGSSLDDDEEYVTDDEEEDEDEEDLGEAKIGTYMVRLKSQVRDGFEIETSKKVKQLEPGISLPGYEERENENGIIRVRLTPIESNQQAWVSTKTGAGDIVLERMFTLGDTAGLGI